MPVGFDRPPNDRRNLVDLVDTDGRVLDEGFDVGFRRLFAEYLDGAVLHRLEELFAGDDLALFARERIGIHACHDAVFLERRVGEIHLLHRPHDGGLACAGVTDHQEIPDRFTTQVLEDGHRDVAECLILTRDMLAHDAEEVGRLRVMRLRARAKITTHSWTPIHPVWLRCSSVIYLDIIHFSRLAIRAPRRSFILARTLRLGLTFARRAIIPSGLGPVACPNGHPAARSGAAPRRGTHRDRSTSREPAPPRATAT